jgi:twinkle protein
MIIKPVQLAEALIEDKECYSTGFPGLDKRMKLAKGFLAVFSGFPSMGKTEFLDAILVNMAIQTSKWCSLIFSPENGGTKAHMLRLAEKYIGKSANSFSNQEIRTATKWLDAHFAWMELENPTLDAILESATEYAESQFLDILVIDPWNEVMHYKKGAMIHDYLAESLMKFRQFGRKYNVLVCIVAHPSKTQKDKDGCYPMPELYDIADGTMWRNKCDYGVIVHRPDMSKNQMLVSVQKIKFKWLGQYLSPLLLDYDREGSGRFKETTDEYYTLPEQTPF